MTLGKKIGILSGLALIAILVGIFLFRYYWVFGEGVKAGEMNYFVYKGYIFKTYEGKLIQAGFKNAASTKGETGLRSNEFEFSVEDKAVGDSLMRCSGRMVELHYKEYKNPLPWRGMSAYVADSIISVR